MNPYKSPQEEDRQNSRLKRLELEVNFLWTLLLVNIVMTGVLLIMMIRAYS